MATRNIAVAEAGPRAADVMLDAPKTFPPTTTVEQARAVFESPKQKLLLVCDGPRFVGAIRPDGLDGADDPSATIDAYLDPSVPVIGPDDPSERVPDLVAEAGLTRIPVVGAGGELLGLVCFNRSPASFCVR